MSEETKNSRLPPPAFPPGSRKHVQRNSRPKPVPAPSGDEADDAFISPDDPIPARKDPVDQAFINPDDPMPQRPDPSVGPAFISPDDPIPPRSESDEQEEGIVTDMGYDPHVDHEELVTGGDPHVMELVEAVGKLAEALKRRGEAGLRTKPGMSRFDRTLRAYCVGYLAGRRAEDEVEADLEVDVE